MSQKIALVTGAGQGIGRGIAVRLSERGFAVVAADQDGERAEETRALLETPGTACEVDVSDSAAVDRAVKEIEETVGPIETLVNNAGINRDAMLHKMTDDQWESVIAVDLTGVFNTCRAVGQHMRSRRSGRIVNISSASWEGNIGQANYAAAKAGVVGLTRSIAKEFARFTITANAICPGFIETDMTRSMPEHLYEAQIGKIGLGRVGTPDDVARAVAFFAGPDAGYVTGQVLAVGGGYTL